jgi:hypothetical protein
MHINLIILDGVYNRFSSSWPFSYRPVIENYLVSKGIIDFEMQVVPSKELSILIEEEKISLNHYFKNEHIEKEYGIFRSKLIRRINFLEKEYNLSCLTRQYRDVYFFNTLSKALQNEEKLILFDNTKINSDMIEVLNIIHEEEGTENLMPVNRIKLVKKILEIKPQILVARDQKNYCLDETFSKLEEKEYITISQGFISTTVKGKI